MLVFLFSGIRDPAKVLYYIFSLPSAQRRVLSCHSELCVCVVSCISERGGVGGGGGGNKLVPVLIIGEFSLVVTASSTTSTPVVATTGSHHTAVGGGGGGWKADDNWERMAASRRPCCSGGGGRTLGENGASKMFGLGSSSGDGLRGPGGMRGGGASGLTGSTGPTGPSPDSLLDICARIVAQQIPFQRIEERYDRIPEPVQRRVIFWSFPRNERDICMYSSLSRPSVNSLEYQNLPFHRGLKLLETGCVDNVLQVGTYQIFYSTPSSFSPSSPSAHNCQNNSSPILFFPTEARRQKLFGHVSVSFTFPSSKRREAGKKNVYINEQITNERRVRGKGLRRRP